MKGVTFISTRPPGRSGKLRELLGVHGAELVEMPMIDIRSIPMADRERDILRTTGQFDWIIFTSSNGVTRFFEQLYHVNGSYKIRGDTRIGVIGRETGSELASFGHNADYVSSVSTGRAFSQELRDLFADRNPRVLLPVGRLAGKTVEDGLKDVAEVVRINVYDTVMPDHINEEALRIIGEDGYGMIIFTSRSGFTNFCRAAGDRIDLDSLRIACIGTTTAGALAQAGITPAVTATKMSSSGIAQAIVSYYKGDVTGTKEAPDKKYEL